MSRHEVQTYTGRGAISATFVMEGVPVIRANVWNQKGYSSKTFRPDDIVAARSWIDELLAPQESSK